MTSSEIDKLKKISIVDWLDKNGYRRQRGSGKYVSFYSPFSPESNASFKVNTLKNTFNDYHGAVKGDIIDLVMLLERKSFTEACNILSEDKGIEITEFKPKISPPGVTVHSVSELEDSDLITYFCDIRKISLPVLMKYVKQVVISFPFGSNPDKRYTIGGFKNDIGGWEFRNSWMKVASQPKYFTTIGEKSDSVMLFEGFINFLSYLTYHNLTEPDNRAYVLNGLGQGAVLMPFLSDKRILFYGDNDNPSSNFLSTLTGNVVDMRYIYWLHNDFNAMLQNI